MSGAHLITLRVPNALAARSSRSRASVLPILSVPKPGAICIPRSARCQSVTKPWKGSHTEEHSISRAKRGDAKDPSASAAASGIEEKNVNEGIADNTKSQATTQRGGRQQETRAKKEHPAAPKPIIGMNDERGGVC